MPRLLSLNLGPVRPLQVGDHQVLSGIVKTPHEGPVAVGPLGLEGDEQADRSVHGGRGRAVSAYPAEHHPFWQTVRAQVGVAAWGAPLPPGLFGENLTLEGLLENQLWVGDVLRFPHCELAVSEPRLPCDKLDAAMGFPHASKLMTRSAWCGWYLAVRVPGTIAAGQAFDVVAGPRELGITELFRTRTGRD